MQNLRARVMLRMPFAGVERKPGDVISSVDWMSASDTARTALVNGQYVVLIGDDGKAISSHDGALPADTTLEARVAALEAKQEESLNLLRQIAAGTAPKAKRQPAKRAKRK